MNAYDVIETRGIVSGSLIFLLGSFWLGYRVYVLRLKSKTVDSDELADLQARVVELELQGLDKKKTERRLAGLEEIVTSEEFDLKRKLREVEQLSKVTG